MSAALAAEARRLATTSYPGWSEDVVRLLGAIADAVAARPAAALAALVGEARALASKLAKQRDYGDSDTVERAADALAEQAGRVRVLDGALTTIAGDAADDDLSEWDVADVYRRLREARAAARAFAEGGSSDV